MEDPAQLGSRVQDYLRDYKIFSEKITNVIRQASQEKMTEEQKQIIGALVSDLDVDIERSASLYYMLVIFEIICFSQLINLSDNVSSPQYLFTTLSK